VVKNNFCVVSSLMDIERAIKERTIDEAKNEDYNIYVNLGSYSHQTMDLLLELVCKMKYYKYEPKIHFDSKELNLTEDDIALITDFSVEMKDMNVNVDFYDASENYSIEQGVEAYFNAEKFVDAVKALDLSPLETHFLIHNHLSSIKYKENEQEKRKSRTLINVLTGEDVVCLGYAKEGQYLRKKLGIFSVVQILNSYDKQGKSLGTHANNLVYINDPKYKVKGFGYSDVTWDVFDEDEKPFLNYLFTLLPLSDKDCLKKENLVVYERVFNALYSKEDLVLLIEDMLLDISTCRRAFNDFGLAEDFEEIESETKRSGSFFLKKQEACKKLKQFFKENKIKKDVYKDAVGMPEESSLAFLIAHFMQEDVDESILNLSLNGFSAYANKKQDYDNQAEKYGVSAEVFDNYITVLNDISKGYDDSFDEDISSAYVRLKSISMLEQILKIGSIKSLSLSTVKEVISNIYRKQGASEKFIDYQIKEIVEKCVDQADKIFNEKARNCFKKEALRREKEEQKREIE